jgi:hypothetical protein
MNDTQLAQRLESMDRTLFMGLKCMTVLLEDLELATRDDVSQEEREIARLRIREMISSLKGMF